jgi:hypothetical protein
MLSATATSDPSYSLGWDRTMFFIKFKTHVVIGVVPLCSKVRSIAVGTEETDPADAVASVHPRILSFL